MKFSLLKVTKFLFLSSILATTVACSDNTHTNPTASDNIITTLDTKDEPTTTGPNNFIINLDVTQEMQSQISECHNEFNLDLFITGPNNYIKTFKQKLSEPSKIKDSYKLSVKETGQYILEIYINGKYIQSTAQSIYPESIDNDGIINKTVVIEHRSLCR